MPNVTLCAPAKLNLVLSVGPPQGPSEHRPGWHPIASWMAAIDLCDDLTVEPLSPGDRSSLDLRFADDAPRPTPIDWPPERDLAFRAITALESHTRRPLATRLTLRKRIPVGAGLGGGSSNAAAALIALNHAHTLNLAPADLARIGATLGSDVPFFIDAHASALAPDSGHTRAIPHPALVTHMGEQIERLAFIHAELVLLIPPFSCLTPDIYRAFDALNPSPLRAADVRARATHHVLDPASLFNDLTRAACAHHPPLGRLLAHAAEISGLPAHLSGSGSGIFIITPPERSRALAAHLASDPLLCECALIATHLADPHQ